MKTLTVPELAAMLSDGGRFPHRPFALFDIREAGEAERGHVPDATFLPRRQIEFRIAELVPVRATPIVLYGGADDRASLAARTLAALGYTDVRVLDGGFPAWRAAGHEVVTGSNVPSKHFGERVLVEQRIPYLTAEDVARKVAAGESIVVCDSRTPGEYKLATIPGAYGEPSFDLTLQYARLAKEYDTVVVNCAGRTRSIIGTATLQVLGLDRVYALENGTMGWVLAGMTLERGAERRLPAPDATQKAAGEEAADKLAREHSIPRVDAAQLAQWMDAGGKETTYVFDVRPVDEYAAGHVPGAICVTGGQACQRTDDFVAVHSARIVLVDESEARSLVTAYWFKRMGFRDVCVLRGGLAQWQREGRPVATGRGHRDPLGIDAARAATKGLSIDAFAAWRRDHPEAALIDVGTSRQFSAAHVPGARWLPRGWIEARAGDVAPPSKPVAVCASDAQQACFAAATLAAMGYGDVVYLDASMNAWKRAGQPVATGLAGEAEANDVIEPPYHKGRDEMLRYIEWETKLGHESHATRAQ